EGFCIENLLAVAPDHDAYCYRTHVGAEIDLVLARGGRPHIAIEIKRSSAPSLSKGFAIACDDLRIEERYLVYPGNETFPIRHGTQVIGLAELMERVGEAA
ncbi:MAG: DUF4143 domain-containing protein, partial [Betaproteobacteria bacterium]|nr:DUF4143 domain-containing protein [Betaproteobacteria bacterium]